MSERVLNTPLTQAGKFGGITKSYNNIEDCILKFMEV